MSAVQPAATTKSTIAVSGLTPIVPRGGASSCVTGVAMLPVTAVAIGATAAMAASSTVWLLTRGSLPASDPVRQYTVHQVAGCLMWPLGACAAAPIIAAFADPLIFIVTSAVTALCGARDSAASQ